MGGEGGERGEDAVLEFAVGLPGGQERDLIDEHHRERIFRCGGVVAGGPARPVLRVGNPVFEQFGDAFRLGGVAAVPVGKAPDLEADRQVATTLAALIIGGSLASVQVPDETGGQDQTDDTDKNKLGNGDADAPVRPRSR